MKVLIGALEFEGPYHDIDLLSDCAGVFAFICHDEDDDEYELLELADSDFVREYVQHHNKRAEWREDGLDVAVVVHYTGDLTAAERGEIKDALERELDLAVAA